MGRAKAVVAAVVAVVLAGRTAGAAGAVVNDVTGLDPTPVEAIAEPTSIAEVQRLVRTHRGPVSIGGGRYSMGGQIAAPGTLFVDMRRMDRILSISTAARTITVEAGITWRKIQEAIDPENLSLEIMQSYANFTVGGSLGVNAHGRYVNRGPLVHAVRAIQVVLADGTLIDASPTHDRDVFYGAIGGYGGLGVIVTATLALAPNEPLERRAERLPVADYPRYFAERVAPSADAVFHNADLYPPAFDTVQAMTFSRTDRPPTEPARLQAGGTPRLVDRLVLGWVGETRAGKWLREAVVDPWRLRGTPVVWRNWEASYDVAGLGSLSGDGFTYALEEYFVPVGRFADFVPRMADVFRRHAANVVNVSIRHAIRDPGTYLAWAREDCFAFVVYYRQGTTQADRDAVGVWTRELIDAVLASGGTYYLPYQIHATDAQFHAAYPRARELFALKRRLDPTYKFRNALWERYFPSGPAARRAARTASVRAELLARPDYRRGEDQTFLTLPEWLIVYSADDLAAWLDGRLPSGFPYLRSVQQFWDTYAAAARATADRHGSNLGYHAMIWTIGASFTAEYVVKALWEGTIGRLVELVALGDDPGRRTPEDRFMAEVAREYATFIHETPWYAFPFFARLRALWSDVGTGEPWTVRRVERRAALTLELGGKAVWGWLLSLATGAAYAPEDLEVRAWVKASASSLPASSGVRTLARLADGRRLVSFPRYERFTRALRATAGPRLRFVEIAGNAEILVTVLAPAEWSGAPRLGSVVGEWPLVTDGRRKRVAVAVPVARLDRVVAGAGRRGIEVEHVYDY